MLSYQHAYHAGNLADVHKHALLAWMLGYLTRKDKPLSYIETHAGRGLYDLSGPEAARTGEAVQGIARAVDWFPADHPYARALAQIRAQHGVDAYPGSPLIAATLLRPTDHIHLAELHPAEHSALKSVVSGRIGQVRKTDGAALAHSLCPPEPRRGLMLIDPSWEVKTDYDTWPKLLRQLHAKWNVGILCLWYPVLISGAERAMVNRLGAELPQGWRHEVRFPPARPGHGMVGSGLFVLNPPFGLDAEAARLRARFDGLGRSASR
ncbi:23S rRNA (adenine(2030)-N(6))-methyltransferase RlmJ [Thalassococcus sp. CAU 1522]|uniref:Ribosomal RNA large subunit methyltransferase J n=1 Tax=Thalassococcus arenae TaxID=2851652 RepID=A0ABS6N8V4_9RHOB|nr:23S rRNA (adenine(2030)-N(6))-methyltransferase RlmJ [Thalassococcus arenae]MBV2360434.1 23S rRNA (adenine(2030)-N(6))-methyltransferase RlmJ [Thalassococcus arenae]